MYRNRQLIATLLMSLPELHLKSVYDKSATTLPFNAGLNPQDGFLVGEQGTSWAMEEDRYRCLEAGCDDYIIKPIIQEELFQKLQEFLTKISDNKN